MKTFSGTAEVSIKESALEKSPQEQIKEELAIRYGLSNVSETYQKIIAILREENFDISRNAMQKMLDYTKEAIDESTWAISQKELEGRMGRKIHHLQTCCIRS